MESRQVMNGEQHVAGGHDRPRPQQGHQGGRDQNSRGQSQQHARRAADRCAPAAGPGHVEDMQRQHRNQIKSRQDRADPDAETGARRHAEPGHQSERRARQAGDQPARQIQRPGHPGRERDIFGVVEHRPVVGGAEHEKHDGQQAGARPGEEPRQTPGGDDAENTERGAEQVTRLEVRKRRERRDRRGDQIEQAAVKIEIAVAESPSIGQSREVEVEEEPAISVLDFFVGGDAVVAKRDGDDANERDENCQRKPVEEPLARPPPREGGVSRRPQPFGFDETHEPRVSWIAGTATSARSPEVENGTVLPRRSALAVADPAPTARYPA